MKPSIRYPVLALAVLLLCSAAATAAAPASTTTYTVIVQEDGSALWQLEYRTLLATDSDLAAFDNYTRDLPSVYLPQVQDLMQRSAAQAAVAASRPMAISNVTGNAVVQTSPTGRYGVVVYSFGWSGFAEPDGTLAVGDAFTGGLYLAKDNTLILRYPSGWTVSRAEPAPDLERDGLVWYGLRSFGPGEPRVTFEKSPFPLVPVIAVLFLISLAGAGFMVYQRRKNREIPDEQAGPEETAAPISEAEQAGLEERILKILETAGGEQYQTEIVRALGIPKSTVSSSLNSLHQRGIIRKVKKGRENLIRLVRDRM
ncbi:MAG: helix-turn-helix domain-containing protein [Methanoregula sp.]|nr:helix-turn-helix domain-containing protein [Methanoregula sp.]